MTVKHVTSAVQSEISFDAGTGDLDPIAVDGMQMKKTLTGMNHKEPVDLEPMKNKLKVSQGTTVGKIPTFDAEQIPDLPSMGTPDEVVSIDNGEHIRFIATSIDNGPLPVLRIIDDGSLTTAYGFSRSMFFLKEDSSVGEADITVPATCWAGWKDNTLIEKHDNYINIKRTSGELEGLTMIVRPSDSVIPDSALSLIPVIDDPVIINQKLFDEALKKVMPSAEAEDYIGVKSTRGQIVLDIVNKKRGSGIRSTCDASGTMGQLYFFASTLYTIISKTKDTEVWIQEGDRGQVLFCGSDGTIGYVIKPSKIANI
jgi:hypothetical protein